MGLPDGEKVYTISRFDRMYERDRQTDTQTHRQTDTAWRQRPRLMQTTAKTDEYVQL